MTKYAHLTNAELIRLWDTLDPIYLLEEIRHRFERIIAARPDLKDNRPEQPN